MLVQNMASLTISTMALFTMGNMKKNKIAPNFMKRSNITFSENRQNRAD